MLDNITIEHTTSNFIEVFLFDENVNKHQINSVEKGALLKIDFKIPFIKEEVTIFRKFITKRLHRASTLIKIPKGKSVTLLGEQIDVVSKSYKGNIFVFIEKGNIKLHNVQQDVLVKLYSGNVFATLKNTNIDITSNLGIIKVNDLVVAKVYQKTIEKKLQTFTVKTIKANILLTTIKE